MTTAFQAVSRNSQPLSALNMTPLIDVLLVLLILFIITIPAATHSLEINVQAGDPSPRIDIRPINTITATADNHIAWNGAAVSQPQLAGLLATAHRMRPEPELRYEPQAQAGYPFALSVLRTIKASGVSDFGIVGNERFATFGKNR